MPTLISFSDLVQTLQWLKSKATASPRSPSFLSSGPPFDNTSLLPLPWSFADTTGRWVNHFFFVSSLHEQCAQKCAVFVRSEGPRRPLAFFFLWIFPRPRTYSFKQSLRFFHAFNHGARFDHNFSFPSLKSFFLPRKTLLYPKLELSRDLPRPSLGVCPPLSLPVHSSRIPDQCLFALGPRAGLSSLFNSPGLPLPPIRTSASSPKFS